MKKLNYLLIVLLTLFSCNIAGAATDGFIVKGKIIDKTNEPLVGVTVFNVRTSKGESTDVDGKFAISAQQGDTLKITYIGFSNQNIVVSNKNNLVITLEENVEFLEGTVVTAMGISREKKSLGYAVSEVGGAELTKAKNISALNSLSGKVAGLVINQTAGGPSGSSRVTIRGISNMSGSNEPLYVVDGVPLDNTKMGESTVYGGGYDLGDNISAIGADNIENMVVLKGPAASALYGSRASNGAIIITTKKADNSKDFVVSFNNSSLFEVQSLDQSEIQHTYGQGYQGQISMQGWSAGIWGPKYDPDLLVPDPVANAFTGNNSALDGAVMTPYTYKPNYLTGFFDVGHTITNNVAISRTKDDTGIRLSYTNLTNTDIKPNSGMDRNSFDLSVNTKLGKKVFVDAKVGYVHESVNNRPGLAGNKSNISSMIMDVPPNISITDMKSFYQDAAGNYLDFSGNGKSGMNPYWVIYRFHNESKKDFFRGSMNLRYEYDEHLQFSVNAGSNLTWFNFEDYVPTTTPGVESGSMTIKNKQDKSYNVEAKVTYKNTFAQHLSLQAVAGVTMYKLDNSSDNISGSDMLMTDVESINSFAERTYSQSAYEKQINSAWALLSLGWKDYLYLDGTVRVDHSSTLPEKNNTYLYPSVSGSFVFTNFFNINNNVLSFGKIRASLAQVGSDTDPYQLSLTYATSELPFYDYGRGGISNTVIPNFDLKPTMTTSAEVGVELQFLNNRLGVDATYYSQDSKDQILKIATSITSGFGSKLANIGEMTNKGVELQIYGTPIKTKDWTWDLRFNYAKNVNEVVSLTEDMDIYTLQDATWAGVKVTAAVGEPYGAIMGKTYSRTSSGDIILDPISHLPVPSDDKDIVNLGNASWDWTGGLVSNLRYKHLTLGMQFDFKFGADMYSFTARQMLRHGKAKRTLTGRAGWYRSEEERLDAGVSQEDWIPTGGLLVNGVIPVLDEAGNAVLDSEGNPTYTKNTVPVNPQTYYDIIGNSFPEESIYDNSYVKIREITLSYDLPSKWFGKIISSAQVSLIAKNPFILYKNIPYIDPESTYNTSWAGGLEYGSLPTRRSFGFNISVKF